MVKPAVRTLTNASDLKTCALWNRAAVDELWAAKAGRRLDDADIDTFRVVAIERNRMQKGRRGGLQALPDQVAVCRIGAYVLVLGHPAARHKECDSCGYR
jgi:hypothetical protein